MGLKLSALLVCDGPGCTMKTHVVIERDVVRVGGGLGLIEDDATMVSLPEGWTAGGPQGSHYGVRCPTCSPLVIGG